MTIDLYHHPQKIQQSLLHDREIINAKPMRTAQMAGVHGPIIFAMIVIHNSTPDTDGVDYNSTSAGDVEEPAIWYNHTMSLTTSKIKLPAIIRFVLASLAQLRF